MLLDRATNECDEGVQPLRRQRAVTTDVIDVVRDRRLVEERHPSQMREHPGMRFREEGYVDGMPAGGRVAEARLIGKDRFACSGRSLDDVDAGDEKASLKDAV